MRGILAALAIVLLPIGCGGAATPSVSGRVSSSGASSAASKPTASAKTAAKADPKKHPDKSATKDGLVTMVTPSLLLPDLTGDRGVLAFEDGHRRVLIDRMRLIAHEDGSLERAAQLLPHGSVTAVKMPSRLGGGYVFHASSRGGTQLWRAATWLGKLEPLVQLNSEANEVVAGFDRLYLRLSQNNQLIAIDAQSGESLPLGPLPPASAYGQLGFADGWRAVVEADLRGPLATFDAGSTWRPVNIDGRPTAIAVMGGDPAILVSNGFYVVDARGAVTFHTVGKSAEVEDSAEPAVRPHGPFGRRPLRAAVEDGWPDSPTTAVVARGGSLARISLHDGSVLQVKEQAYPERQASCHATRMGASFGFICGERDGATVLYGFEAPLNMRERLRFKKPRFISSSDNGALVVRGGCTDDTYVLGSRTYCIVAKDGKTREIRVKAQNQDMGIERIVALSDGRVAVLIPPRAAAAGQLTILKGTTATTLPLALPSKPKGVHRDLRRGLWLEGFQEREPGVLGGWVEAGGPIVGVRINLRDGKVKAGDVRHDATGAVLSGRFALSLGEGDLAAESTDGGMTWDPIDLPERDDDPASSPSRACGPVGCALKGWIRVGWTKPASEQDLAQAPTPPTLYTPLRSSVPLSIQCQVLGSFTPPLPEKAAASPSRPPSLSSFSTRRYGRHGAIENISSWLPFRNIAPPTLAKDELGYDNGAPYDVVSLRVYVWGKKGADWTRTGRWLMRFDDRFDPTGGVRTSAISASPWPDEATAAEGIGGYAYGAANWGAFLDTSGRAALVHSCRGSGCNFYAVSEGQPVLPLRDDAGRSSSFLRPFPHGAVRLGETWFFIAPGTSYEAISLWRVDLGTATRIATYPRPTRAGYAVEPARLIRRALGTGLGLLIALPADPGARSGSWVVLPINPDTGDLGEAIFLGRKDLSDVRTDACGPAQDGWQFDTALDSSPNLDLGGTYSSIDSTELRLRMDPGVACLDGIAVRIQGTFSKATPASNNLIDPGASAIPLAATERTSGKRWSLRCSRRGTFGN